MTESPTSSPQSNHTTIMATSLAEIDPTPSSPPKSSSSKKSTLVLPAAASPIDPCSLAQRRYFTGSDAVLSRAKTLSIAGKIEPGMSAHLPENTATFKFFGSFKNYSTGHYTIHWRVKALPDFHIPNGLHFVVKISYDTEPDISGTLDVILPPHKLNTIGRDQWHNLTLEEKVVIQPHEGWANIQVILRNNENENRDEYSGFHVEHVEIRPVGLRTENQPGVRNMVVQRASIPVMVLDTTRAYPKSKDMPYFPADVPITRIAISKKSRFMASLGHSKDDVFITVWDMSFIKNPSNPYRNIAALYKGTATARIHHPGVGDLAIGLAISPYGEQITIFQEPKIGQWLEGSVAPKPDFKFRLFNNPMVPQVSVTVNMDAPSTSNVDEKAQEAAADETPGKQRLTSSTSVSSAGSSTTGGLLLESVDWEHEILQSLVGFGEFVPGAKKPDWESNDLGTLASNIDDTEESGKDGKDSKDGKNGYTQPNSLFVTCNGIYIDVYEISQERRWKRLHTITITDLIPTLSSRITCKMMMDSISSNNFMWLEDSGRSCTIWDLRTGSNIAHISSLDNALFKGPTFRGHSKMAISPHESIVALASVDGSLTTYFANTGMAIDDRKFPGYKIEYVGFSAQDDKLIVVLRDSVTFELIGKQLDTLQLKSETIINQTPIPTIGTTLQAYFNIKGYFNRGLVIEADGPNINCYVSNQPSSSKVNKMSDTVLQSHPADVLYESQYDDHIQYRLQTAFHRELLPEGDGVFYWVHRVEVIREDLKDRTQRLIFSFIPEPWMRATTAEVSHPENLLTAFFVPCGTRFAVNGTQTLQIWNLPTHENSKCSLQYIWSQPRGDEDLAPGGIAYKSGRVRDYYLETMDATIFLDRVTGNTVAEIKVNDKSKKRVISIPGPGTIGAHFAILYCFRSIHLLAAAYGYSSRESKKASRDAQQSFTFEDHAEAILRFTREHINRMMSIGVYLPGKGGNGGNFQANKQRNRPPRNEKPSVSNDAAIVLLPGAVGLGATTEAGPEVAAGPRLIDEGVTIHGNSNRRQAESFDDRPAPLHIQETITARDMGPTMDFVQRKNVVQARGFDFTPEPPRKQTTPNHPQVITVLTLLLDQKYLQKANHHFVQGLLNTSNGDWIPRDNSALNPIRRAIESRNATLVEAFIDYCILNAKKYHPAYLMPAVQCLNELSERYPAILADMFRKASYVPAHNYAYVSSHALVANAQYTEWFKSKMMFWNFITGRSWEKSNNINDYDKPVFSLRSQLPFRSTSFLNILNIETSIREKRQGKFPAKRETNEEEVKKRSNKDYKIYVTPFPKLSMYGPYKPWYEGLDTAQSAFTDIAGEDYFDSPAMVATLEFKWYKFGFRYWMVRFLIVFIFFLMIVIITALQITYSTRGSDAEDITDRYMDNWRPFIMVAIGFGAGLCGYEAMQFIYAPRKYIKSPYNYLDLTAYTWTIIGCILLVNSEVGTIDKDQGIDIGPHQIWVMSFGILFLYFNILFELRVVRQLGIVVNIILNITRSIVWFFLIFALILVSFTHALMHLLHTQQYHPLCDPTADVKGCEEPGGFPTNVFAALSVTYFFLSGRYDPVDTSLDGASVSFHIMMILFFFISAILFLNILIALMNDAFNESKDQGQLAWLKQWSEVIAEVEVFLMTQNTRQNRNYFPDYIYYGANEQEAELYESRFFIASKSNLSIENRFLVDTVTVEQNAAQLTQRQVLRDVQTLSKELEKLKSNQDEFNQDVIRLTEVVAAYLATTAPQEGPDSDNESFTSSSHSDTSVSPVENDPPTSGASMGRETQSAPLGGAGRASGPHSPPVPSPPPPTAVPGGATISLPSPVRPGASPPPPSRASSAPAAPSLPISTIGHVSSGGPPPPPPPSLPTEGTSAYPTRPSMSRPIAAGSTPYSAPGSAPGAPRPIPSSSAPSNPGSAPFIPTPPPMPIQTSMPMPSPPPPMAQEEALELDTGMEERKSSQPLVVDERNDEDEITLDIDFDTKVPSLGDVVEDMKDKMSKSKKSSSPISEDKDEEEGDSNVPGGGEDEDDMPSPPPPPPQPIVAPIIVRPSTRPLPMSKVPQPPSSAPAVVTVPAPTQQQQQAGRRFKKISPGAETTDSPTTYTPTTGAEGRHNPPPITTLPVAPSKKRQQQQQQQQQQSQQPVPPVLNQLPAGGPTIYHPDIGSSKTTSASKVPRYKVIELQDPERERSDTAPVIGSSSGAGTTGTRTTTTHNNTAFRQRVQRVVAVQTVDDALRAHRRIEDNNVSHPVYVVHQPAPADARNQRQQQRFRRDSDDDGLYDDDEDEDEGHDGREDEGLYGHRNKGKKSVRSSTAPAARLLDEIQTTHTPPQSQPQGQQHGGRPQRPQLPQIHPRRQQQP
ncbi:hypothetical protein KI688_006010 [Linnemannia hyalina]|uniref:Ion transport domain-containing protein n=1 Tax=Linnemannia hyalina TaxID=64524 RepID=A0A9P7Y1X5_9FUNG|nr:hypothetical protein KI688_006010 [Linnemannia hyalina]